MFQLRVRIASFLTLILANSFAIADTVEGFSEPIAKVELAVIEPGLLESVEVVEGDRVSEGQLVATLNSEVLRKGLAIAEQRAIATGAILAAQAELRLRDGRLAQLKLLRDRGHATEHEYARALADYDIADARLILAREEKTLSELEVDRIKTQISRRIVRSPFDGVVSNVHKRVGEAFSPGDTVILTVVQLEQLKAKFSLTTNQAEQLSLGQQVRITFPVTAQTTSGQVDHISPVIDAKSGTIEVSVIVDNSEGKFRSGARCLAEFSESTADTRTRDVSTTSGPGSR